MSFLPEVKDGVLVIKAPKEAKIKLKRQKSRFKGTNPRAKGTSLCQQNKNLRKVGTKLWREWYDSTKFIRDL